MDVEYVPAGELPGGHQWLIVTTKAGYVAVLAVDAVAAGAALDVYGKMASTSNADWSASA